MSEEYTKLLEYREEVRTELTRRLERLKRIEQEIASEEMRVESLSRGRSVLAGDTPRALVQASFKAKLQRSLERLRHDRTEASQDVARAEQRLADVEEELLSHDRAINDSDTETIE